MNGPGKFEKGLVTCSEGELSNTGTLGNIHGGMDTSLVTDVTVSVVHGGSGTSRATSLVSLSTVSMVISRIIAALIITNTL